MRQTFSSSNPAKSYTQAHFYLPNQPMKWKVYHRLEAKNNSAWMCACEALLLSHVYKQWWVCVCVCVYYGRDVIGQSTKPLAASLPPSLPHGFSHQLQRLLRLGLAAWISTACLMGRFLEGNMDYLLVAPPSSPQYPQNVRKQTSPHPQHVIPKISSLFSNQPNSEFCP